MNGKPHDPPISKCEVSSHNRADFVIFRASNLCFIFDDVSMQ